jgi:hypothetical protein
VDEQRNRSPRRFPQSHPSISPGGPELQMWARPPNPSASRAANQCQGVRPQVRFRPVSGLSVNSGLSHPHETTSRILALGNDAEPVDQSECSCPSIALFDGGKERRKSTYITLEACEIAAGHGDALL